MTNKSVWLILVIGCLLIAVKNSGSFSAPDAQEKSKTMKADGLTNVNNTAQQPKEIMKRLKSMKPEEVYSIFIDLNAKEIIDFDTLMKRLESVQVIYTAEVHTNQRHHDVQLYILEALSKRNPKTALAMEFLYRSQQPLLNDYSRGKVSDEDFETLVRSGFGSWYPYYKPLIQYAAKSKLKLIGMNVEPEIKEKMVTQGWDKLKPAEQKLIAKDIDTTNEAHRKYVMDMFQGMRAMGPLKDRNLSERFYIMQCLWDETFGEAIANYLKASDDQSIQMMVVAGSGHIEYKFNTPDRAYKRYPASYKTIVPIEIASLDDLPSDDEIFSPDIIKGSVGIIGDFIYFSPSSDKIK